MNINDLTIGEAKQLASMFGGSTETACHPLLGKKVVAVLPHGFIHFGTLFSEGGVLGLAEASNLRYWAKRDGGLPAFAKEGPLSGDRIDPIGTVFIQNVLFFYPCGDWSE